MFQIFLLLFVYLFCQNSEMIASDSESAAKRARPDQTSTSEAAYALLGLAKAHFPGSSSRSSSPSSSASSPKTVGLTEEEEEDSTFKSEFKPFPVTWGVDPRDDESSPSSQTSLFRAGTKRDREGEASSSSSDSRSMTPVLSRASTPASSSSSSSPFPLKAKYFSAAQQHLKDHTFFGHKYDLIFRYFAAMKDHMDPYKRKDGFRGGHFGQTQQAIMENPDNPLVAAFAMVLKLQKSREFDTAKKQITRHTEQLNQLLPEEKRLDLKRLTQTRDVKAFDEAFAPYKHDERG